MALFINWSTNFIEISLDGGVAGTDFFADVDLMTYNMARNAPQGLRIRKIVFIPSAAADTVIVRDGQNGPRVFSAVNLLGTWDILKDDYRDDSKIDVGKVINPYIYNNERVIGIDNQAYIIFEL